MAPLSPWQPWQNASIAGPGLNFLSATKERIGWRQDRPSTRPNVAGAPEEYRGVLLNRQNDAPLDGLEELIVALHDIGEVLQRPSLARLVRIARAAEQLTGPQPPTAHYQRP